MLIPINQKLQDARDEEGFTLIELMIVIVIIGILAAIALPIFGNQQKNAHKAAVKSDVRNTNTSLATALTKNPTATGFVTYKTGDAVPTLAAGQAAVQTTNTNDNVVTITDIANTSSAPDSATGNGAWNGYQILGKSPVVDGYCYYFTSTTGKYSESDNCSTASGTPSVTDTSTPTPSATATIAPPVVTTLKTYTFETNSDYSGWYAGGEQVRTDTDYRHTGRQGLYVNSLKTNFYARVPTSAITYVVGKTYRVTGWVYIESSYPTTMTLSAGSGNVSAGVSTTGTWTQLQIDFTATNTSGPSIQFNSSNSGFLHVDDVTISSVS